MKKSMDDIHIAEIGGLFDNCDELLFLSDQNLYEFDFIIIDSSSLIAEINGTSEKKILTKVNELKEFIKRKNIPVVFMFSDEGAFTFSGGADASIGKILGLEVVEERINGKKIEINADSLLADFMNNNIRNFEYLVTFPIHPGVSIGNAKAKSKSIGFYTKDFIFLPTLLEDCDVNYNDFLEEVYQLALRVRKDEEVSSIPEWASEYLLPGEQEESLKLESITQAIAALDQKRLQSQQRLATYAPLKYLWTTSGTRLEVAVKEVFKELGFELLATKHNRDDLIMNWKGHIVIGEVKGQNKSAAEKNVAQLEKWVSTYYEEHEVKPKGLLIVNTYRELPLAERQDVSFPEQMLPYSVKRDHCLLTTIQLTGLLLFCRSNPELKDQEIDRLLETVGRYPKFDDWTSFLSAKAQTPQVEKQTKKEKVRDR